MALAPEKEVNMAGKWVQSANIKKGGLHQSLGIPESQKIPASKLSVKSGDSPKVKKQKILAKTFSKMRPKKGYGIGKKG